MLGLQACSTTSDLYSLYNFYVKHFYMLLLLYYVMYGSALQICETHLLLANLPCTYKRSRVHRAHFQQLSFCYSYFNSQPILADKIYHLSQAWWLTPTILATQEIDIRRMAIQCQSTKMSSIPHLNQYKVEHDGMWLSFQLCRKHKQDCSSASPYPVHNFKTLLKKNKNG
jgi:hypothetical protein